jgi:uncharacterized protein YceK
MKGSRIAVCLLFSTAALSGCASSHSTAIPAAPAPQFYAAQTPGVVEHVWEEPMVDVVDVPAGLDPEGHYYRPSHQEILEIRQGRWRLYKPDPSDR